MAKYVFNSTDDEGTGLSESHGLACELVAWQFLTFVSEKELIDCLLYEIPDPSHDGPVSHISPGVAYMPSKVSSDPDEETPLVQSHPHQDQTRLSRPPGQPRSVSFTDATDDYGAEDHVKHAVDEEAIRTLVGMNSLEIAAITGAKKFMCREPVQKIINDIWNGNIMFWESLSVHAVRKPRIYNRRLVDPYARLRVPLYQKAFQIAFFVTFLLLFYVVLVGRVTERIAFTEVLLYLWVAAFAVDEFGEIQDAGLLFYKIDFWSLWDVAIIGISTAFVALRMIGLLQDSPFVTDRAFDVLSLVALFLVPR